jgi:hypothetical protein
MVGWLCARGGTELAFFIAGVIGLAATFYAALQLRLAPASKQAHVVRLVTSRPRS